jgi:selenocysteine lyase/cysteine desulfurase
MIDWGEIRKQFPVTNRLAYLNSAAAGPISVSAQVAATDYYQKMMADGDVHWNRWLTELEATRARVAKFINADPDEIAFTTNTSSGMNLIVDALEERGEILSSELEFPVTTLPWMHRRIPVHLLPPVAGEVDMQSIRDAMTHNTGVIALSHVQFSNGFRIDLDELGKNKSDHALVVNASQSAGGFEIDVKRMQIEPQSFAADTLESIELVECRRTFRDAQLRASASSRCRGPNRVGLSPLRGNIRAWRFREAHRGSRHRKYSSPHS